MVRITVDGAEIEYERQAKNRSESVFEARLVVESRTGERSVRSVEIGASTRDDLSAERIETALAEWQGAHPGLTIEQLVVEETKRCGFGRRVDEAAAETAATAAAGGDQSEAPLYRGGAAARSPVGFGDVAVERGEEVTFHVAGPSSSVYGTDTGTVTGVKTGTDDYNVLIIDTGSGTKRVREDWIVDESEDGATDESEDEAADGSEDGAAAESG